MPNKPYKGLETYREDDQDIFFGRENEIELIADHLRLFRLTIFHGASGVGKSSILRAGVAARLRQEARDNLQDEDYKASLIAVVVFPPLGESWLSEQNELVKRFKEQIVADIQEIDPSILAPKEDLPLIETLKEWTEKIGEGKDDGKLLIILDQFENFFLAYSQKEEERNYYAQELAQVVNYFGLRVNFLISIRSSAFTQLERFKAFIPNLMDKRIELKRLNQKSAEKAIKKPIEFYNQQHPEQKIEIEAGLVEQVLDLVKAEEKKEFEAPYLQLIMQSLWNYEREHGSFKLQQQTLIDLNGEEERGIVELHFKKQMKELNPQEWHIATHIFNYLVTPSGERIPQKAKDLSDYYRQQAEDLSKYYININERVSEPEKFPENLVKELLEKLSKDSFRILRASEGDRYEIYFNVLAQVVADFLQIRRQIQNLAREAEKAWRQDFALSQLEALQAAMEAGSALQEIIKKDSDWLKNYDTIPVIRTLQYILENIREQRQFKHYTNSPIYGASISPDGKKLATASFDGIVRLWDLETIQEKPIKEFRDPSESVFNLAFSPDGKKLATASWNGTVILWDLEGNKSTPYLVLGKPGDKEISLVAFSPDGQQLATTSLDGNIRLWNLQESSFISQEIENPAMPFAHSLDFVNQGEQLVIAFWDGSVYLWDWRRNEKYKLGETQSQLEVPQPELLATVCLKGIVSLWDLANLSEIKEKWQAHHALISYVSYDATKDELDTVSWDGRVRRCQVKEKTWSEFLCNRNPIYRASFSPDRQKLVTVSTSTGAAHLWDLRNDYSSRLGREQLVVCEGHTNIVYCVTSSPDGKQFASASADGTVRLWDWQGKPIGKPFTFDSPVYRVSFSPDGQYLGVALADAKGVAYLVDLKINSPNYRVSFSPDGQHLGFTLADAKNKASLMDLKSGKKTEFRQHKNTVYCLNFNAKGDQIASASEDGTVSLWDLQGKPLRTLLPQSGTIYYVSFSPQDHKLAIACLNGKIFLQDLQEETPSFLCIGQHANAVYCLSFSPDGKLLASASSDGTARLWDLEGKEKEFQFRHESMVFWVSFSPDGKRLATAGGDGKVCLWQVKDGRKIAEFKHHDGNVFSVCFSPDGKQIATASEDGSVKLRRIEDLEELLERACNWLKDSCS